MSTVDQKQKVGKFDKKFAETEVYEKSKNVQGVTLPSNTSYRPSSQGMRLPPSGSPRMAKSTSMGTMDHERGVPHIVDQDDIIGLTQDVKNFSDGLARLKAVFNAPFADADADEDMRVLAHERLGEVLCTLKSVLQQYPPLNSTELFTAAGTLISKIKNYDYEDHGGERLEQAFNDAIDQLALEFSSSVSEYLMGDLQHGVYEEEGKTKSYENLLSVSQDASDKEEVEPEKEETVIHLTVEQIDATLMSLQAGLDLAFQRAKAWSRYLKDVMSYIERRAQLEVEYSKNLSRLAVSMKPALTEEVSHTMGFLPLQSVYCTVLSQDVEYSKTCQATFTLLQTSKFVEPLSLRRTEHDKARKSMKDSWVKEVKKMQDTVANLRKAQTLYVTRQQDYEKAKDLAQKSETELLSQSSQSSNLTAKLDKKKKLEEDAMHKAAETETTYKACVAEANNRQHELHRVKTELLATVREQIYLSDQAIKKVTVDYFQLLQTVSAPVPVQYHTLCEASKRYTPGSQYGEFVRRLPVSTTAPQQYDEFKFEPYHGSRHGDMQSRKISTQSNESASSDHLSADGSPGLTPRRDDSASNKSSSSNKYRVPVKAWGQQGFALGSDTDSQSGSSKSLDSSPSSSPHPLAHKKMVLAGSMDDLIEVPAGVKQLLSIPGTEGSQLDPHSIMTRQSRRRNTTFGVDFQEQVEHYHTAVPPIITKCLKEVERRGICVKGIYRVSGVKSTVESVCQLVEMDPESVDLTRENPNVISNVLKLYLRQLPEPLLTFRLYPCFIQIAKDDTTAGVNREDTVEKLHEMVDALPFSNRKTCGVLMHHLLRVTGQSEQNHMSASNLGIVFGPTLLRPQGGNASLASLIDTTHQIRVVELLIVSAQNLFGPDLDHQVIPCQTIVEPMEKPTTLTVPQATIEVPPKEPEPKKRILASPSEKLPEHMASRLIPPHVPAPSQTKSSEETISIPGYTNLDKKPTTSVKGAPPVIQTSDGEDCIDLDDSAELESDEDLPESLLPDDSQLSQNSLLITGRERTASDLPEPEFITMV